MTALRLFGSLRAEEAAAKDDALRARIEKGLGILGSLQPATHLAGQTLADLFDQLAVITLAHRRVQVDQLN